MKNFWNFRRASFNLRPFFYIIPFLLLSIILVSQGCIKEPTSIGLDLKDGYLNAAFTDTVTLTAYAVEEDTLNTTGLIFNYLGCFVDEIFGTTTASIYTQLVPSSNGVNFGTSPEFDSIVLTLRYTGGFYGDTLNPFAVKIYELDEDISKDKIYYQHHTIKHKNVNLTYSDFYLYPKPNTKVKVDTLLGAHVRIRLSDDLGRRFMKDVKELATADDFKKYFKGLYIEAAPFRNSGSLVNFSLINALSGIQLYYHDKDSVNKKNQFSIIINSADAVRFNNYKHDYKAGEQKFVNQIDSLKTVKEREMLGEKMLYVQSMGGIKTKITFPFVKETFKNVVINKAELVITNIGESLEKYPAPNKLGIQAVNSSGTLVNIHDALTGNANYFGGSYDEKTKEYRFRITRYIQDVIQRDNYRNYIYLVTEGAAAYAHRLILKGTDKNEASRLRLEIYYTEY